MKPRIKLGGLAVLLMAGAALSLTYPASAQQSEDCDPNYSGCVPFEDTPDWDVDCAGGSGNGPGYVQGPVDVIGDDIYGLDEDGDGVACESDATSTTTAVTTTTTAPLGGAVGEDTGSDLVEAEPATPVPAQPTFTG